MRAERDKEAGRTARYRKRSGRACAAAWTVTARCQTFTATTSASSRDAHHSAPKTLMLMTKTPLTFFCGSGKHVFGNLPCSVAAMGQVPRSGREHAAENSFVLVNTDKRAISLSTVTNGSTQSSTVSTKERPSRPHN